MKTTFMVLAVAFIASQILADKKTPVPSVNSINLNSSRSYRVAGTVINQSGNTFTVMADGKQLTFSGAKLKDVPRVGETIDVTYTQSPGGPMEATTVKSSKSNSSDRGAADKLTGRVLSQQGRNFTVMANGKTVTFSGAKLKDLPKVGDIVDITYTQSPGGPMEATTVKSSKSNTSD